MMKRFLTNIFLVLVCLSMTALPVQAETNAFDNSAAVATIDRQISELEQQIALFVQLRSAIQQQLPIVHDAARSMLHGEQELGDLVKQARIRYQNNALKVQGKLGINIALLGSTALSPARNAIAAAATAVNLLLADPVMNELFTMAGLGNPIAARKRRLLEIAEGSFPSQPRIQYYLDIQVSDDHAVLDRDRQLIRHGEAGMDEVRDLRRELMSLHREYETLVATLSGTIAKLRAELETLKRHRSFTAGEQPKLEKTEAPFLTVIASNVGADIEDFDVLRSEINARVRDLDLFTRGITNAAAEMDADRVAREQGFITESIEMQVYDQQGQRSGSASATVQWLAWDGGISSKRARDNLKLSDKVKELQTISFGEACPSINHQKAYADTREFWDLFFQARQNHIQFLGALVEQVHSDVQNLSAMEEYQQLPILLGELRSLTRIYDARRQAFFEKHGSYPKGHPAIGEVRDRWLTPINGLFAKMASEIDTLASGIQSAEDELTRYRAEVEARMGELPTILEACRAEIEIGAKAQLEAARETFRSIEAYVNRVDAWMAWLNSLAGVSVLERQSDGSRRQTIYRLNPDWIDQLLAEQETPCGGLASLDQALQPLLLEGQILFDAVESSQPATFTISSNDILEQNLPSLHAQLLKEAAALEGAAENLLAAGSRFSDSPTDIFSIAELLQQKKLPLLIGAKPNSAGLQNLLKTATSEHQGTINVLRNLEIEINSSLGRDRIPADEFSRLKIGIEKNLDRHVQALGCLGDDHPLNTGIHETVEALLMLLDGLKSKPIYYDAGPRIQELTLLSNSLRNLHLGEDETYISRFRQLEAAYRDYDQWFEANKGVLEEEQRRQISQLLYDIGALLPVHHEHLKMLEWMTKSTTPPSNQQIQTLYQDFINAYGRGDLRGLLRLLADDWRGGDGSDTRDVEEYLSNSFRVFERIQYRISGFSAQSMGESVRVSYNVRIIGENRRQRLTHEENVKVVEDVGLINGEPRILRTISGSQWLR